MELLGQIVVPVADEDDAAATATALSPYLDRIEHITAVHVIEKGGGVIDKAPVEKRRADAAALLSTFEERLDGTVAVDTRVAFGTDVVDTIVETALDVNAAAVVFYPRGGSRLTRLLSGDTAGRLVAGATLPIVSLAEVEQPGSAPKSGVNDGREVDG
jgi:nucleotide-binding universal stress UspA family protein